MKKIYIYSLTTLLLWGAASCKKPNQFGDTNLDPTAVTAPVTSALIASVEHNLPNYITSRTAFGINGAAYSQYASETQYPGTSLYNLPQVDFAGEYSGNLYDCQNVINTSTDKNAVAAATIMQQYIFWVLTDSFGDIPYSQALAGIKAITPAYDKQEDIYKGILSKTAAAVASLGGGSVPGDVVYGGSTDKWKKFGNSLIILASTQLSKIKPGASDYAAAAFKTAVAGGYIATNADNFSVPFTADYHNPWYILYDGRYDWGESTTMTGMLASLNDQRQLVYGGPYNDPNKASGGTLSTTTGVPYGLARTEANNFVASHPDWAYLLRADKRTSTSPVVVTSAAEVLLAVSEGINIGWTTGNAAATYVDGINKSFEQWGVDAPPASYFTQAGVVFSAKNLAIEQWISAYPDGHMGWNIWRKTGFPALTPAPGATNSSKKILRRFTYTSAESQTNGANLKAAVARITGAQPGVDSPENAVWWDVLGQ